MQARHDHADAAASCQQHAEAATALTTAQQQLALMQQRLEVAERQMEVLRAQLGAVEGDRVHIAAEKQRLQVGGCPFACRSAAGGVFAGMCSVCRAHLR